MTLQEIERAVLELSKEDRAHIAGRLLESLDDETGEANEKLWLDEVERRAKEMDQNPELGRPVSEFLRELNQRFPT
jgi:putative addiction module component (TIGR02574 family)